MPFGFASKHGVLIGPHDSANGELSLIHRTKLSLRTLAEIQRTLGFLPPTRQVSPAEFDRLLQATYANGSSTSQSIAADLDEDVDLAALVENVQDTGDLLEQEDEAPVIRLINALLSEALREGASDIHIETFEKNVQIRFRIDGMLREVLNPKRGLAPLIVSRIKVMSKLDIAEKRIPQDGRTTIRIGGKEIDVRVSVLPTGNGERVVLRLLDKGAARLQLANLGMVSNQLEEVRELVRAPHGIFLVTGPTGSGKTTTLYASLGELPTQELNVMTIEDPIEYNLAGISQTQVNTRAGMTFARGLRAIVRQDPDIVMVGEIRDLETAEIAIQASLTGHLVLSTLHTNTAIGAVTRMADMGVEPYLLSSSLIGVLAQRLVRVLCQHCRKETESSEIESELLGIPAGTKIYEAVGCASCKQTGYLGRTGIYELIVIDDELRQRIHDRQGEQALASYAHNVRQSIRADGMQKVVDGITSVREVLRVSLAA